MFLKSVEFYPQAVVEEMGPFGIPVQDPALLRVIKPLASGERQIQTRQVRGRSNIHNILEGIPGRAEIKENVNCER